MSSVCVLTYRSKCMASEGEMDPIIPVELVAQHISTSAYIMTLSELTWEMCYFESSCIHWVETKFFRGGGGTELKPSFFFLRGGWVAKHQSKGSVFSSRPAWWYQFTKFSHALWFLSLGFVTIVVYGFRAHIFCVFCYRLEWNSCLKAFHSFVNWCWNLHNADCSSHILHTYHTKYA